MMKNLTGGLLLRIAKRTLNQLVFNLTLMMILLVVAVLWLLTLPLRLLNKGLRMSAEWMWNQWQR